MGAVYLPPSTSASDSAAQAGFAAEEPSFGDMAANAGLTGGASMVGGAAAGIACAVYAPPMVPWCVSAGSGVGASAGNALAQWFTHGRVDLAEVGAAGGIAAAMGGFGSAAGLATASAKGIAVPLLARAVVNGPVVNAVEAAATFMQTGDTDAAMQRLGDVKAAAVRIVAGEICYQGARAASPYLLRKFGAASPAVQQAATPQEIEAALAAMEKQAASGLSSHHAMEIYVSYRDGKPVLDAELYIAAQRAAAARAAQPVPAAQPATPPVERAPVDPSVPYASGEPTGPGYVLAAGTPGRGSLPSSIIPGRYGPEGFRTDFEALAKQVAAEAKAQGRPDPTLTPTDVKTKQ